ncbi:MAG: sigma-70 family RNA polymerase sigma factor [Chloroflexota bacterium]|nr:sigma-70 family RNA polymerase sigma factor [Chloroflexota bacterium]
MRRMADGDTAALAVLYGRYAGAVYSLIYRVVNDRETAEELLNEAFLRAWRQASLFDVRRGKLSTWLLSVARNLSIDELRSRRSRPERAEQAGGEEVPLEIVDERVDVEAEVWQEQRRSLIRQALRQLPPNQREPLELAYFGGLTQSEIATRLGDPLGTIKTRMRLGLQKLRDILLLQGFGREIS